MQGGGEELNAGAHGGADVFAGERDCREAGEAGGCGVAQDRFAGFGVVVTGAELAYRGAGGDEEIETFEEG